MNIFKSLFNYINSNERKEIKQNNTETLTLPLEVVNVVKRNNIINLNGNCTIIFDDYTIISEKLTNEQYDELQLLMNKEDIIKFINSIKNLKIEKVELVELQTSDFEIFTGNIDFTLRNSNVYLNPVNLKLPDLLIASFIEILEKLSFSKDLVEKDILLEKYQALKMFWYKATLAKTDIARNSLYQFITENDIELTSSGNFVAYRRIVKINEELDDTVVQFISKEYQKLKSWKKSPKNYIIYKDDNNNYFRTKEKNVCKRWFQDLNNEVIGNLKKLYLNLSEIKENRYTDDYTETYDIRIGETYKILNNDLDRNKNGSCGGALHCCDGFNYKYDYFGNTPVVVIVNPMHMVKTDTGCTGKCGVSQMFIAAVTEMDENGNYKNIPKNELLNFDEIYHNETLEELQEMVKDLKFDEFTEVNKEEVENIIELLNIQSILNNKVIIV